MLEKKVIVEREDLQWLAYQVAILDDMDGLDGDACMKLEELLEKYNLERYNEELSEEDV